jgi:hypothetical protein
MEYNELNRQKVGELIRKNLTPDLLPKKWLQRNSTNPMFGHCHNASGCLQKVFGAANIKLYRALDDEGIYHWWAVDKDNNLIDLTVEQYTSTGRLPPWEYTKGEKASILGFEYRKRVQRLYERVTDELNNKPNGLADLIK